MKTIYACVLFLSLSFCSKRKKDFRSKSKNSKKKEHEYFEFEKEKFSDKEVFSGRVSVDSHHTRSVILMIDDD